jgi:hypothetical protein
LAALRARLTRLAREKRAARSGGAGVAERNAERGTADEIDNLQQLPPKEFDRALVGLLLERDLGEGLSGDPRFQALIDRTSAILEDDPDIQALFRQVQREVREPG